MTRSSDQLGFDALLADAAEENAARDFAKKTAHLPNDLATAIPFHAAQIEAHHAAMLAGDFDAAIAIRDEAQLLARTLNGDKPGIIADQDAPGCILARKCAATPDKLPLWGQDAAFTVTLKGVDMAVTLNGMFGIGACHMPYAGFAVRAIDRSKPFVSATGYRSFLGCSVPIQRGLIPSDFVRHVVQAHIAQALNGRWVTIKDVSGS